MKRILPLILALLFCSASRSQIMIDTLALQNFDSTAFNPNWPFSGPVVYNIMGMTTTAMSPSNSPTGIGNSRSWESTTQSGGLVLTFTNVTIPAGYDSLRIHFNLAAMDLTSASGGGPDNLDYVLVEVSFNGGPFYSRMRIRGSTANNSYWPYSATGKAKLYYQPQSEIVFANSTSGLQAGGYSNCEVVFPGSVTQIALRMTGRSSSASDTWLVDNVILTGEKLATGIHTASKTSSVRVFPNPANDVVYINRTNSANSTLQVYNSIGTVVLTKELNKENESINVSSLSDGIYFLKFDGLTKKLIKQ